MLLLLEVSVCVHTETSCLFSSLAKKRKSFMLGVYKACGASPYLIHAKEPPYSSSSNDKPCYMVNVEPVGVPLHSKHSPSKPRNQAELGT